MIAEEETNIMKEASRASTPNSKASNPANDTADQQVSEPIDELNPIEIKPQEQAINTNAEILDQHETEFQREKDRRLEQLKELLLDKSKVSESNYKNSKKEQLLLAYVENFNRQYTYLYPGRKELLLTPENSFGIKKFICTTIRPTQLPYKELYEYRTCARFVADYLNYVPLESPHELPKVIHSPAFTLKLQYGNAFDFSIVLTSLLRGVGYDAYVVSGYASRDVTLMSQTKKQIFDFSHLIPLNSMQQSQLNLDLAIDPSKEAMNSKYKLKAPRQLTSQFLKKQEAKFNALKNKLTDTKITSQQSDALDIEEEEEDELEGLRIHAWVLILPGKREIAEPFFIESTTGEIYPADHKFYLGVESVFSSTNFWVNMQVCYDGLKGISFDLGDVSKWEFVMLENSRPGGRSKYETENKMAFDEGSDDEENPSEVLDLPPSWVEPLSISKEQFESKCPSGSKTTEYKNVKCEVFAEYFRPDGMVLRLTLLQGPEAGKVTEYYENRRDKLRQRVIIEKENTIHESFNPGRLHGLQEHLIVEGKTKEMRFYPEARSDGLYIRTDINSKIIERYVDREDFLTYRSVNFDTINATEGDTSDHIIKMTEKFDYKKHPTKPEDPFKRTYFLKEEKIRIVYQLQPGCIISSFREFKKPTPDQKGHQIELLADFQTNPYLKEPKKQHLVMQLTELLKAEHNCLQAVKLSERETKDIITSRFAEEKDVSLSISVYDTIRNNTKLPAENETEYRKEEEEAKNAELDYLSPFLVNYNDPKALTKEEALQVKEQCLKSLKERLLEKATIIQSRLDEITSEYQQRQVAYSKNADSMTVEETDEYVRFCNDALFKIHVFEKRLAKHKELAPEKYIEMDGRLRSDPRLRVAF